MQATSVRLSRLLNPQLGIPPGKKSLQHAYVGYSSSREDGVSSSASYPLYTHGISSAKMTPNSGLEV